MIDLTNLNRLSRQKVEKGVLQARELLLEESKKSLAVFARAMWKVVEPKQEYVHNWHIEDICYHLEAVSKFEIQNLLINMPPRHMKSMLTCVMWPAWVWLNDPSMKWVFSSYASSLSRRDSVMCRRLLESNLYQAFFEPEWRLTDDQNTKQRFDNTSQGYRIATSVDGSGTGEGGDIIVVDDPMKATDADSEIKRKRVLDWWDHEMQNRVNSPTECGRVIVMQRLHEEDLSGHVLEQDDWVHLCLPAEYKGKTYSTPIWEDPRKIEGTPLWPKRYPIEWIRKERIKQGSRAASAQLDQDPMPTDSALFNRSWWKFYKEKPKKFKRIVQIWDTAQKPGVTNDYSVCATWGETENGYYLLDIFRDKLTAPVLENTVKIQASKWNPMAIVIEDKSSGSSLIQNLQAKTTLPIKAFNPGQKDKVIRAAFASPTVEAGNCYLPVDAPWVEDYIAEHERFPNGKNDDQVDTTSMMVLYLVKPQRKLRVRST